MKFLTNSEEGKVDIFNILIKEKTITEIGKKYIWFSLEIGFLAKLVE